MKRHWAWIFLIVLLSGWWIGGDGAVDLSMRLQAPSYSHPFGTDELGRDLFSRFLLGGARSLTLGIGITSINLTMGLGAALIAHPFSFPRRCLLAVADMLASLPAILLALLLLAVLRPGVLSLVLALAIGGWIPYTRLALNRLDALSVDASLLQVQLMGGPLRHRLKRHLLPRLSLVLGTQAAVGVGFVVLVEGGLSFLGAGFPPEQASWGTMLGAGRTFLLVNPWGMFWPALGMIGLLLAADRARRDIVEQIGW